MVDITRGMVKKNKQNLKPPKTAQLIYTAQTTVEENRLWNTQTATKTTLKIAKRSLQCTVPVYCWHFAHGQSRPPHSIAGGQALYAHGIASSASSPHRRLDIRNNLDY
jgi:hypothetical protein